MKEIIDKASEILAALPPETVTYAPWALSLCLLLIAMLQRRRIATLRRKLNRLDTQEALRIRNHLKL